MAHTVTSEMTDVELRRKESELRDELFRLRFQHHTGQLQSDVRVHPPGGRRAK